MYVFNIFLPLSGIFKIWDLIIVVDKMAVSSYEEQERSSSWLAHGKVISMLFFVFTDLALNSTLDYDTYNNNLTKNIILGTYCVTWDIVFLKIIYQYIPSLFCFFFLCVY